MARFLSSKRSYTRFFFLIFWFAGCSPSSIEDLRYEADFEMKKLTIELQAVKTKEDLQMRSGFIKKRMNKLASLLLETRKFPEVPLEASFAAESLFVELARLYEIPGVRELMELYEEEAVHVLDRKSRKFS